MSGQLVLDRVPKKSLFEGNIRWQRSRAGQALQVREKDVAGRPPTQVCPWSLERLQRVGQPGLWDAGRPRRRRLPSRPRAGSPGLASRLGTGLPPRGACVAPRGLE